MKKFYGKLTAILLVLVISLTAVPVSAADSVLHETKKTTAITSGVSFDEVTRLYDRGWLKLYAMKIDVKDPNVKMSVISSLAETGLKETVYDLAKSNGVLAAVNGDFFGSTAVSTSMGIVFEDGKLTEARNYYNVSDLEYAGLYIDSQRTPYVDYLKVSHIGFLTNGTAKIEIDAKNKVTDMKKPVYIDRSAMTTTEKLDKRFSNLYKIIVEGGRIKDISAAGTTVTVPENGYLIVMNGPTAMSVLKNFAVGDTASFYENLQFVGNSSLSKDNVQFGISGGSKILEAGVTKDNGLIIEAQKRHPRTVIGVNKDKSQIVIIAIDGRSNDSIGATHYEAAEILREYGAWDAFHLDGGGSTTVVSRHEGDTELTLDNHPSEGGVQRKIPNALGISSANGTGQLSGLYITANGKKEGITALATLSLQLSVKGHDVNLNPVPLGQVTYRVDGVTGTFSGNTFTPSTAGEAVITAESGGITNSINVNVVSAPNKVRITPNQVTLSPGEAVNFKAFLVNEDGYGVEVTDNVSSWGVSPSIGTFGGKGQFTASQNGAATITADYYGFKGVAAVASGTYTKPITSAADKGISFTPITPGVTGAAAYSTAVTRNGKDALQISYNFKANVANSQIAAVNFQNAATGVLGSPKAFGFWLTGDGAGSTVNAVFTDGAGKEQTYSFNAKMDKGDWKYYYQTFPESNEIPLKLSRITITSAKNLKTAVNAKVYLDDVRVAYNYKPDKNVMQDGILNDPKRTDLSSQAGGADIVVFGPTAHAKTSFEKEMFNRAVAAMQQNSRLAVFAGYTGSLPAMSVDNVKWMDAYSVKTIDNARVINLASSKNGLRDTNAPQWKSFVNDLNANGINTIIVLNRDIWNKNFGFSDTKERDLFHSVLKEYKEKTGADVMVIAGISNETTGSIVDGIRYITLNGLVSGGGENPSDYSLLRIRATEGGMNYDIEELR